ncbi:MAG: hypothetical protein ABFD76_15140 [Smithella sp.]
MTGEMFINGYDVYQEFGVTPLRGTFDEVMKPVSNKSPITAELENEHGETIFFPNDAALIQARDFAIPLAIVAVNGNDFLDKKARFETLLRTGSFLIFFPQVNLSLTCYLKEVTQYSQLEPIKINATRRVSAIINLQLREPNPADRTLTKEAHAYGVLIDSEQANPDLTRIGNLDMAKAASANELAVQGTLNGFGYLKRFQKANGLYYADGSASVVDGSAGNVVTHMPPFYFLVETVTETTTKLWVSPYPVPGFAKHTGFTLGCFKASVNNAAVFGKPVNSLWSVANSTTTFRGGNNDATNDALEKGFLGKPRTVLSRTSFRAYSQNQGVDYGLIDYDTHLALFMLFITKYATFHCQKAISPKMNGYYAGGLGAGLTTVVAADWNTYNTYYPIVKCGLTLGLGLTDGEVSKLITGFGASGDITVKQNSFLGIEGVFGDIFEWVQGINFIKQTVEQGGKNIAYVYPTNVYEDVVSNKYIRQFEFATAASNYIRNMVLGSYFDTMPKVVGNGASSSTFVPDYYYNDQITGNRVLARSGNAADGSYAGLAYANTACTAANTFAFYGSRLGYYGRVRPGL